MIPTTKAGKECQSRMCLNGRDAMKESIPCQTCHGLGWLPAPGDALTAKEAETIHKAGKDVEEYMGRGRWAVISNLQSAIFTEGERFRLAPAQEELIPKAYAASAGPHEPEEPLGKNWWCEACQEEVIPLHVTNSEHHDVRVGGCGNRVSPRKPAAKAKSLNEMVNEIANIHDRQYRLCARVCMRQLASWLISLTPAQLEALRKERA